MLKKKNKNFFRGTSAATQSPPSTAAATRKPSLPPSQASPIGGSSTTTINTAASSVFSQCGSSCSAIICTSLRTMVSQNRRRYQQDGFNLDLTYITDRIIAMGYPADTTEALYRNSMSHIVKFLEQYHSAHYKVFNLRGQYVYDTSRFHNRVVSFEMADHQPPRLELMAPFCREVSVVIGGIFALDMCALDLDLFSKRFTSIWRRIRAMWLPSTAKRAKVGRA